MTTHTKKKRAKRTPVDFFLMGFAAFVILGTIFGVFYIVNSQSSGKAAMQKAQMRPLKYPTRTSLVNATGNDLVFGYQAGAVYILLPKDDLRGDIARSALLQAVTAPFADNPGALPGAKLYTASGLEGLRVIDLEKAGRLNTAEIITALCTRSDHDSPVCKGYASQRVTKLRSRLNNVLHHVFFAHLAEGDAAVMTFSHGRASFYQHYTPLPNEPDDAIKVGRNRLSQVPCRDCFGG